MTYAFRIRRRLIVLLLAFNICLKAVEGNHRYDLTRLDCC